MSMNDDAIVDWYMRRGLPGNFVRQVLADRNALNAKYYYDYGVSNAAALHLMFRLGGVSMIPKTSTSKSGRAVLNGIKKLGVTGQMDHKNAVADANMKIIRDIIDTELPEPPIHLHHPDDLTPWMKPTDPALVAYLEVQCRIHGVKPLEGRNALLSYLKSPEDVEPKQARLAIQRALARLREQAFDWRRHGVDEQLSGYIYALFGIEFSRYLVKRASPLTGTIEDTVGRYNRMRYINDVLEVPFDIEHVWERPTSRWTLAVMTRALVAGRPAPVEFEVELNRLGLDAEAGHAEYSSLASFYEAEAGHAEYSSLASFYEANARKIGELGLTDDKMFLMLVVAVLRTQCIPDLGTDGKISALDQRMMQRVDEASGVNYAYFNGEDTPIMYGGSSSRTGGDDDESELNRMQYIDAVVDAATPLWLYAPKLFSGEYPDISLDDMPALDDGSGRPHRTRSGLSSFFRKPFLYNTVVRAGRLSADVAASASATVAAGGATLRGLLHASAAVTPLLLLATPSLAQPDDDDDDALLALLVLLSISHAA
jgi:hypothetical protein